MKVTTPRIHLCTHGPPGGSSCRTHGQGYWTLCSCISHCPSSGLSAGRGNGTHHLHKSQRRLLVSSQGCLPGTRSLQAWVSLKLQGRAWNVCPQGALHTSRVGWGETDRRKNSGCAGIDFLIPSLPLFLGSCTPR